MSRVRKLLYDRLPEIYRIKDEEQTPPGQLKAYLNILDQIQGGIYDNIENLYHDFFIETCNAWAIPYIADLLGSSHLSGDPWTLRADVARTVHHRRRKGTLGAIESLTYALSGWAVHSAELFNHVVWNQHLNHQRPDKEGKPPIPLLIKQKRYIGGAVQGGTVNLRDPALLGFFNGPFDPFAHVVDVKPQIIGAPRYNLPNLGIFLWRLQDFTVPVTRPILYDNTVIDLTAIAAAGEASFALRYDLHPMAQPMVLFNTHRYLADADPPDLSTMDAVPGPMPQARLSTDTPTGHPQAYVDVEFYTTAPPASPGANRVGLSLHMPEPVFSLINWIYRGANLCAWEEGLSPPLREYEIVIDPARGRLLIGVGGATQTDEADPLHNGLYVSATYGFSGSSSGAVGAHPLVRASSVATAVKIDYQTGPGGVPAANGSGLQMALDAVSTLSSDALVIEIGDSQTYELDISLVADADNDDKALWVLNLGRSLWIRAASGERPIIRLKRPLGFRPIDLSDPGVEELDVTLEGLYITWDHAVGVYAANDPLINRAALNRLVLDGCTLDPGSYRALNGTRQAVRYAMNLTEDFGFDDAAERIAFDQTPEIIIKRTISGPLAIDRVYGLSLTDSILDAASGIGDATPALAVHAATGNKENEWGPMLTISNITCFGRMRVERASGTGGIWLHALQVHDDLNGCIKFSYFSGVNDKLPQHHACVLGTQVMISFASDVFGEAGYAQLRLRSDRKILEQGPGRDAMGAFNFLLNTHKWKNINIRYREFMPVGIKPVLIPVT